MAIVNTLKMSFVTADSTRTVNLKYANPNVTSTNVKRLMNDFVANSAIFEINYIAPKSAKLVQTEETIIDISDV